MFHRRIQNPQNNNSRNVHAEQRERGRTKLIAGLRALDEQVKTQFTPTYVDGFTRTDLLVLPYSHEDFLGKFMPRASNRVLIAGGKNSKCDCHNFNVYNEEIE